ncbi:MAG: hypothetical protein WD490_05360 [Opitutales bacterium]
MKKTKQMTASSIASLLTAVGANADVVTSEDFIQLTGLDPVGTSVPWDVNGDEVVDFQLDRANWVQESFHDFALNSAEGGRGIVAPDENPRIQNLGSGFLVGPSLASGTMATAGAESLMRLLLIYGGTQQGSAEGIGGVGFTDGEPGYMGFAFDIGGDTHYGWARLILTPGPIDSGTTGLFIDGWAYESDPDTAISTPIPEPATVATGLGMLALGAVGVRTWRKNKKQAAA